jgi:hypothetical protein
MQVEWETLQLKLPPLEGFLIQQLWKSIFIMLNYKFFELKIQLAMRNAMWIFCNEKKSTARARTNHRDKYLEDG